MKITVLIENQPSGNLCAEHGLSLAIEYRKKHYLLDTGASDAFIKSPLYYYKSGQPWHFSFRNRQCLSFSWTL